MKDYGKQRGSMRPKDVEVTDNAIFIASDIQEYEEDIDGYIMTGFEYHYIEYTKDEYIALLVQKNTDSPDISALTNKITSLEEELAAAKVLLGVD
jgi:hypothetical protein